MADDFQLHILKQGVAAWNKWRAWNPKYRPNLRSADLSGADLRGANLTGTNVTQEQLDSACISKGGNPPALPKGLKPPQKECGPWIR